MTAKPVAQPLGVLCVIPSRLGMGEEFELKIKVLGPAREIPSDNFAWSTWKPKLVGPHNHCVARDIKFYDNVLPAWKGALRLEGGVALEGPAEVEFDGTGQGVFPGDTRPIRTFPGFSWRNPGFHFIKLTEPNTGITAWSNPVYVTEHAPEYRIVWGDPHWQTFFSDGIRCPEELYAFARYEAFLDFGALSDHVEALTDRQWEYFVSVTNDFNAPGRFATLVGQEWTNHKPGHRNIYYRDGHGPILRSNDPRFNTLEKLWKKLDALSVRGKRVLTIPHHTSDNVMGCDWSFGWNAKYEHAVEVFSGWGSSECHAVEGNIWPLKADVKGKHIRDALNLGFRFGFVGGGDIHSGRPGDNLARKISKETGAIIEKSQQGLTAAYVPVLTRENIFDAMDEHRTYATTKSRIFLETKVNAGYGTFEMEVRAASEEGIRYIDIIRNGSETGRLVPALDRRIIEATVPGTPLKRGEYCYVRVTTEKENQAWSSPVFGPE